MEINEIILWLVIVAGIMFFYFAIVKTQNNLPSQCYTNLQPNRYFKGSPSPFIENFITKTLTIQSVDGRAIQTSQVSDTGSMRPTLGDGSIPIIISSITANDLSIGDIVIYQCNQNPFIHRIVKIENLSGILYYTMKGDNNNVDDLQSSGCKSQLSDIKGKVVGVLY